MTTMTTARLGNIAPLWSVSYLAMMMIMTMTTVNGFSPTTFSCSYSSSKNPITSHHSRSSSSSSRRRSIPTTFQQHWPLLFLNANNNNDDDDDGTVGKGSNWIEKSFPVMTSEREKIDAKKIDDYNLGISGDAFQTGLLSERMYETILTNQLRRGPPDNTPLPKEILQALQLAAMDFTAKEATRAALLQNGLELILQEVEEDVGMWGDVDSIRLLPIDSDDDDESSSPSTSSRKLYDSLEEAVVDWTPGQTFDFVVRQVPAKLRELSVEELLQVLDKDGSLQQEANEERKKKQQQQQQQQKEDNNDKDGDTDDDDDDNDNDDVFR